MGSYERAARVVAGVMLLWLALFVEWPDAWEAVFALLGAAALVTAWMRFCPIKQMLLKRWRALR